MNPRVEKFAVSTVRTDIYVKGQMLLNIEQCPKYATVIVSRFESVLLQKLHVAAAAQAIQAFHNASPSRTDLPLITK